MTYDLSVCNKIVSNLYRDVMIQLALLILLNLMYVGFWAGLIIYIWRHKG